MTNYKLFDFIPLALRLKIYYFLKFQRRLNLKKPKLYTEKLQYRKLHLLPIYSELSDKFLVRKFIKNKIGEQYLIPLISSYSDANSINLGLLPQQFVIKTNFGSGGEHIEIIKDKRKTSQDKIILKFDKAMSSTYKGTILGENQYESIEKKIIIEEFVNSKSGDIDDFKFHIFNSKDGFLQIDFDRFSDHKRNLYDLKFNPLPYSLCYPKGNYALPNIEHLNEMKRLALKLSEGFDYVRVDLYLVDGSILFGEMTFTPGSGFEKFSNRQVDRLYGEIWDQK